MKDEDDQLYIYKLYGVSKPRKIKASKTLRAKIGLGTKITEKQIRHAQDIVDFPQYDFEPHALGYLSKIENCVSSMRETQYDREVNYNEIVIPLSAIKGQAGMFGNWLVSHISEIILKFLEKYKRLDNDALALIISYCNAVRASYKMEIFDTSLSGGQKISHELQYAIDRYNQKFLTRTGR
jgi:hypothetical protein